VALNCVMNSRLQRETPFRRAWTQPASGDAGTALGAALWVWHQQSGHTDRWRMQDAYLGPEYDSTAIEKTLRHAKLRYQHCSDIAAATAECLAQEKIVGWFQGRMEFGPRALGARSIIASPRDPAMMQRLNELKDREDFRPVAPAVLEESANDYFEDCTDAPFMTFVYQVRPERAHEIPAIRHVDGSARVQTVNAERSPRYHRMIDSFRALTGVPVIVNTSFNSRGLPIVCTPQDALECFYISPIDALAIGDYLLVK
jgi:carbamoyltransferase